MNKKIIRIAATAMSALMLFSGCGKKAVETEADKALNEDIVITVDDIEYSQADYNLTYMSIYQQAAQNYGMYFGSAWMDQEIEEGKTMLDMIEENATEQIKQMTAILKIAEEKGIKVNKDIEKAVEDQMKKMRDNMGGEEQYKAFLTEMKTTEKALKRYYEFYEILDRVNKKLTQSGNEAYFEKDALKKEFSENYWTVQHILVSTKEGTDAEGNATPAKSEKEAKAIVDEIYAKIQSGADFGELIEEYSEDPGLAKKDDFYTFTVGKMVPEFEEEAKKLAVDEVSAEAVKTDYGFHIIKKYETDTDSAEFKEFKTSKEQEVIADLMQKKTEKLKADVKTDKISKFVDKWNAELKKAMEEAEAKAAEEAAAAETEAPAEEAVESVEPVAEATEAE